MNAKPTHPLRSQLQQLRGGAELLASRLEQSAEDLLRIGAPPDPTLARELLEFDHALRTLLTDGLRLSASPTADLWGTLEAAVRRQEQRTVVAPQLRSLLAIRHQSQNPYEPLEAARSDAAEWLQQLERNAGMPEELLDALLSGRHAAAALVRLVTQAATLTDSDWVADQNLISERYGRTLALAAARGQLHGVRDASDLEASPAPKLTALTAANSIPVVPPSPAAASPPAAQPPQTQTVSEAAAGAMIAPQRPPVSVGAASEPQFVAEAAEAAELAAAARRTLAAAGAARRRELSELIWLLMRHDRIGLAWQLNRGAEALYGGAVAPGTELVRGVALGLALPAPGGAPAQALARWLSELNHPIPAAPVAAAFPSRWSAPQRKLLASALVPAAVCLADVNVPPLWRQVLADEPDLAQLGERIAAAQGADAESPESGCSAPAGVTLSVLQEQVRAWQAQWTTRTIQFTKAEALFTRRHWSVRTSALQRSPAAATLVNGWLYTLRIGAGLTAPILTDSTDKSDVRRLLSRIDSRLLVGARADYPAGTEAIIVPDEAMRTYLQEAAQWARRWLQGPLSTVEDRSAVGSVASPRDHTALRQAVLECRRRVAGTPPQAGSPADEAAQCCLLRSLSKVVARLDGKTAPALLEPEVDELLGGELRRMNIVAVGPHAVPTCSDAVLVERLLSALAQGELLPRDAIATAPLTVDASHATDSVLDVAAGGLTLEEELNAMAQALESAAEAGLISDRDHAGLSARLCAAWNGSETVSTTADRETVLEDLRRRLAARGVGDPAGGTVAAQKKSQAESSPVAGGSLLLDEDAL